MCRSARDTFAYLTEVAIGESPVLLPPNDIEGTVLHLFPGTVVTFAVASKHRSGPHFWRFSTNEFTDVRVKSNAFLHTTFRGPDDGEEALAAIRTTEEPGINPPDIDGRHVRLILRNVAREQAAIDTQNFSLVKQNFPTFFQFERLRGLDHDTLIFESVETVSARNLTHTPATAFGNSLESYPLSRLNTAFVDAALAEQRGNPGSFSAPDILERVRDGVPFAFGPYHQRPKVTYIGYERQIEQQKNVRKRRSPVIDIDHIEADTIEEPAANKRRVEADDEDIPGLSL